MRQLHRWVRQYVRQKTTNTAEARIVGMTLKNLLATTRGKQFVGREKARLLMRSGEQQRKEKRIETGIGALLSGGNASLRSDEVLSGLSSQIKKLVKQDREEDVARLLETLSNEVLKSDESHLKRLMDPVVSSGVMLLEMERWTLLDTLAEALLLWIRTSNEGDGLYKKSILLLQTIMSNSWDSGNYARGDRILSVFHKIRTGQIVKDHAVIELVGLIQDRSYNRPFYQTLLDQFLADGGDVNAGQRLIMMGRPSGDFIVEKLLQEEEPANRLKIVDLLGDMGPVARELIIEKLPEPMPWYGKRNLIKLAGVMAGPEQIEAILPFLRHDDIRVQREAFVSIYTISGDQRKQALIRCLSESSEVMLSQVVKALLPYSDDETTRHLGTLLQDQENYSADIREPLILETVKVLSRSSSVSGRDALLSFLDTQKKKINRRLNPAVWQAAELALKKVEQGLEEAVHSAEITQKERSSASASSAAGRSSATVGLPEEEIQDITEMPGYLEIRQFVEQDNIDSAKESLLKLIGDMAAKRRFQDAETLREWLVEIDPMALSEIIRAAEIIEEEKIATVEQVDIEAWSDLYDELSTEEFATFIHATERKIYSNEAAVFQQGDTQSGLYFINSGSVKVFYQDQAGEKLIKTAVKGDILGADTVVDATVWTASATCLNQAEIMYLAGSELLKWRDEYPSLETKINDFCREYASLEQFFRSTENDRRGAVRHNLSGKISSVLLDDRWRDTGFSTQGDLSDVSRGGLSFFMRISQKKHARVLLGRNIRVMVPMEGAAGLQIDVLGTIIAVRSRQSVENEYSIHVKFNDDLQSVDLQTIIKTNA
jgi:CRP-like cAMP-binding protein